MGNDPLINALQDIRPPSSRNIALRVTPEAERAVNQGHPWVYDQAIIHQSHEGHPGDLAVIFDRKRRFLAAGLYDPHSFIRVRVLQTRKPVPIDRDWIHEKLAAAFQLRAPLYELPSERITTGLRLVHGENDGLPGLIIDRYDQTLVLKLYTSAWIPRLAEVLDSLPDIVSIERLVLRLSRALFRKSEVLHGLKDGQILSGPALEGPVLFWENGLRFEADLVHGQKTGFFFDQRENRARVENFVRGKTVLNVFAYTGGFSVYAARGGAVQITGLDSSRPALEAAARNFRHNLEVPGVGSAQHKTLEADAFEALERLAANGHRFEVVIIDPPAFAQKSTQTAAALSAYERLTALGLRVLSRGGILVQASCSSRVEAGAFFEAVQRAATRAGRALREIERTGHPLDHPITFKEGAYLNCLFGEAG
jgi:23S rRNA (cytosine1962-C5)-methyltransferase